VLEKYKVSGLLDLDFQVIAHERQVRGYRDRPTRTVVEQELRLAVKVDEDAVAEWLRRQGWRVYATNAPPARWPMAQAVLAYRDRNCSGCKDSAGSSQDLHENFTRLSQV
jgi:hypothetical protein